jgi:hypothetical protein
MSGPKHGVYINYRAEIGQVLKLIEKEVFLMKDIIKEGYKLCDIDNNTKELIRKFSNLDIESNITEFKKFLFEQEQKVKEFENIKVSSYDQKTLEHLRRVLSTIKLYKESIISRNQEFSSKILKTISQSKKEAEEYKRKIIDEIKKVINDEELKFLTEWSNSSEISKLLNKLKNLETIEPLKISSERQEIMNLYNTLRNNALENKKNYEIKVETSSRIIEVLAEMNYTNIERKLESDKFGKIIVKAETPSGDWNLTFEINSNNDIKVITPYDDRCYTSLDDILLKLKDVGVEMDLEELKRRKKKESSKGKKERRSSYETDR